MLLQLLDGVPELHVALGEGVGFIGCITKAGQNYRERTTLKAELGSHE